MHRKFEASLGFMRLWRWGGGDRKKRRKGEKDDGVIQWMVIRR